MHANGPRIGKQQVTAMVPLPPQACHVLGCHHEHLTFKNATGISFYIIGPYFLYTYMHTTWHLIHFLRYGMNRACFRLFSVTVCSSLK